MSVEPKKRISEKALKVWKINGMINSLITWIVLIGLGVMVYFFKWPTWIYAVEAAIGLVVTLLSIVIFPKIRWKRWRYEVREQEIELQRGVFIIKRTLVPMVRVQHVDTEQGPILGKFHLATVKISTAATVHEIPAIEVSEADELRNYISTLARVAEDDV
ncbi:membrane protein YdbS with pleckstrin-like domain [Oikeobacillus pervagus]|uniref:Membrane protein YdbS with pleckstrin-like domain n=1 Tax=Oikeobacillus pervagus TaxID=1325931 RepID=A0AAJ1WK81_9BACI|nr:PH domain-containing protein [Oikeobacillus pervagus]MDQ0216313.1 membrane protein YdbS with pleckstrin-like domain [Oikeobacillus pervagus]